MVKGKKQELVRLQIKFKNLMDNFELQIYCYYYF